MPRATPIGRRTRAAVEAAALAIVAGLRTCTGSGPTVSAIGSVEAVAALDPSAFYLACRENGQGRAAHDPGRMVALLLYSYTIGERSSRRIERRFRQRHETALAELFGGVLVLCAESGLVRVGVIAVEGTKAAANAAVQATRDYQQIAREILEDAAAVDDEEDARFGDARGDELPVELSTAQGRRGCLREAKRRLDERRAEEARAFPKSRLDRLKEAKRRLEEEHQVECRANAACAAYRARGVMKDGRRFDRPPDPFQPPATPTGKINLTDLDSRNVKTSRGRVQGYNAQLVCTEDQMVIAADVTLDSPDFGHLEPMITAARDELTRAGITTAPDIVLADAGIDRFLRRGRSAARSEWRLTNAPTTSSSSGDTPRRRCRSEPGRPRRARRRSALTRARQTARTKRATSDFPQQPPCKALAAARRRNRRRSTLSSPLGLSPDERSPSRKGSSCGHRSVRVRAPTATQATHAGARWSTYA